MSAVFKKELRSYFSCMTGYVFLAFFVFITGLYFSHINIFNGSPDYNYTISGTAIMFLITIPMITMRLFSEEAKNKTDQLLFTSPVSITKITLGKYFAALTLFLISMLLTAVFPVILSTRGVLPTAQILGTYLGYFLLGSCFISIGIFVSCLSENQIAVSIATFAIIFVFYILDALAVNFPSGKTSSTIFILCVIFFLCYVLYSRVKDFLLPLVVFLIGVTGLVLAYFYNLEIFDSAIYKTLSWFSLLAHFSNFENGILNLSDIIYYISFIILFLYITINTIEKRRW